MSAVGAWQAFGESISGAVRRIIDRRLPVRLLAVVGVVVVIGVVLSVLRGIVVVTGDPTALYLVTAGAAVAGTIAAGTIRPRTAAVLAAVVGVVGTGLYIRSLPGGIEFLTLVEPAIDDVTTLLSGLSLIRVVNADLWALSVAPAPVFLGWYFALRRRYVAASAVVGSALGLLVLTGDATTGETLAGVGGVVIAVAFGDCERRDERLREVNTVAVVVAAILVVTLFAGIVPGTAGSLLPANGFGESESTMESSLIHAGDSLTVAGSIELSPERRYTVEADEEAYWRVGTYDRYTGDGWVRSGSASGYDGSLPEPPGETRTVEQTYTPESTIATLPAAGEPTRIDGVPVPVRVTPGGSFEPTGTLRAGESYNVESEVLIEDPDQLRGVEAAAPERIEERYTQLPSDTPDRVGERTDRLTAEAENPYDTARVLEHWFRTEYEYSLDIDRPQGDVADAFLFEMEAGYCTYFATAMVTMLRTQEIPARFAVGYTPGEETDDGEWTVRGYNSHAWVEVYVPEHGWVEFDPTPAEPRQAAEGAVLDDSDDGADATPEADNATDEGTETGAETPAEGAENESDIEDPIAADARDEGAGGWSLPSPGAPSEEGVAVSLAALLVLAVFARRRRAGRRVYREVWLRRRPAGPPEEVVAGTYRRAVYLREREGRKKGDNETPRQFLSGTDERFERIAKRYERAQYGDGVDAATAAAAESDLAALLAERSWFRGRKRPAEGPDSV